MKYNSIYFRLNGGLGNQLSQYAAAKKFEREKNVQVIFDDYYLTKSKKNHETLLLDNLFTDIYTLNTFQTSLSRFINRILYKLNYKSKNILGYIFYFESFPETIESDIINVIEGFWQTNDIYNNEIANDIYAKIKDKFDLSKNIEVDTFLNSINNHENSIAVHVRRGDYLTNRSFFKRQQFILPDLYYENAIRKILNTKSGVIDIYVFSDDYIHPNFLKNIKDVCVNIVNRKKYSDLNTFFLISNFKTIVIANSTYSMWASILSFYTNCAKIYGPYKWHKNNSNIDILPTNIEIINY